MKANILVLITAGICGLVGGAATQFLLGSTPAHAGSGKGDGIIIATELAQGYPSRDHRRAPTAPRRIDAPRKIDAPRGTERVEANSRYRAPAAPPSDAPDSIAAKNIGLVNGNAWAANLRVSGNATQLILRTPEGHIGMVLSVPSRLKGKADSAAIRKPQIRFYDQNGYVGSIDGTGARSSTKSVKIPTVRDRLRPRTVRTETADMSGKSDSTATRNDIGDLWDTVYELCAAVKALSKAHEGN